TGGLRETALLLEEHHAEAVKARVAERLAVLGRVHAEAAGAAGTGRQKDVFVDDLLGRHALLVAEMDQDLDQVPHREIGRITLPAIAELLADAERIIVGRIERDDFVAGVLKAARYDVI